MKKILPFLAACSILSGCSLFLQNDWDAAQLVEAAGATLEAMSITDAQVIALSQRTVAQQDASNVLAPDSYQKRLARLLDGVGKINGMPVNYKVYKTSQINAFACGDGSIRVYSGLMDIMSDNELMAIIGHECGHVAHQDSKKAMKQAYLTYAARNVIGAAGGTVGAISNSVLGSIGESFIDSKYSQKQEYAADDYGYEFAVSHGYSPYSMCDALDKLVKLSSGSQASMVQKMFSSHPDSAERARRIRVKADTASRKK